MIFCVSRCSQQALTTRGRRSALMQSAWQSPRRMVQVSGSACREWRDCSVAVQQPARMHLSSASTQSPHLARASSLDSPKEPVFGDAREDSSPICCRRSNVQQWRVNALQRPFAVKAIASQQRLASPVCIHFVALHFSPCKVHAEAQAFMLKKSRSTTSINMAARGREADRQPRARLPSAAAHGGTAAPAVLTAKVACLLRA